MSADRVGSAAELLCRAALRHEDAYLPDGGTVRIREMSIQQRTAFFERMKEGASGIGAWLVAESCIAADGQQMFLPADVAVLESCSPRVVESIARSIMKLSGLMEDEKAGKVSAPSDGSVIV